MFLSNSPKTSPQLPGGLAQTAQVAFNAQTAETRNILAATLVDDVTSEIHFSNTTGSMTFTFKQTHTLSDQNKLQANKNSSFLSALGRFRITSLSKPGIGHHSECVCRSRVALLHIVVDCCLLSAAPSLQLIVAPLAGEESVIEVLHAQCAVGVLALQSA